MALVHDILRIAFLPAFYGRQLPIVALGKQVTERCCISEILPKKRKESGEPSDLILHALNPMYGGGGHSNRAKQHQILLDLLAQLFLQAGCKFPKVMQMVEDLMEQVGPARLQYLLRVEDPDSRMTRFEEICANVNITLPDKQRSKSSADSKFRKLQLSMQHKHEALDLTQLTICEGYFENEDGSPTVVAQTFSPFTTGVSMLDKDQLSQWLQGEPVISGDELAAFVPEPCPSPVGFKFQELSIPVHNAAGSLMILRGKLFQFGSREVKITKKLNQQQSTADIHIVAVTMWKVDHEASVWTNIAQQPVRMAKQLLSKHEPGVMLMQPWGRRYRDSKGETTPEMSESIQFHCLIPDSCYQSLLKKSGWNKVFITPKTQDGKLQDNFRIIWCALSLTELTAKVAMASGCHGLVRGKRSLGVRVDVDNFGSMWELLKPGLPKPDITLLTKQFRLEPMPFGVDRDALTSWAEKHGWGIWPIKSVGGRQWIVASNSNPPSQVLQFNGTPVIVKVVNARPTRDSGPVLAGKHPQAKEDVYQTDVPSDPWLEWRQKHDMPTATGISSFPSSSAATSSGQLPAKVERPVIGPIAQQFDAQANRIASLERQFTQLVETQNGHNQAVAQRFDQMDRDFRTHAEQTRATVTNMQTELQQSINAASQHQDSQLHSAIQELKQFFIRGQKRKDAASDEDEELM